MSTRLGGPCEKTRCGHKIPDFAINKETKKRQRFLLFPLLHRRTPELRELQELGVFNFSCMQKKFVCV
jgi:hypothetical protein